MIGKKSVLSRTSFSNYNTAYIHTLQNIANSSPPEGSVMVWPAYCWRVNNICANCSERVVSAWISGASETINQIKHIHRRLSPQPQHHVVNRNILRGYLAALKGTGNRADTKVSEPVKHLLAVKIVISLSVHAVWSGPLTFSILAKESVGW